MQQSDSAIHIYVYSLPDSFPSYIILLNVVPSVYIRAFSLACREKTKKKNAFSLRVTLGTQSRAVRWSWRGRQFWGFSSQSAGIRWGEHGHHCVLLPWKTESVGLRCDLGKNELPCPARLPRWKWSCSVVSDSVTLWTVAYQAPLSTGFFQASLLEWVAISFSRVYSWPRDRTQVFCTAGRLLTIEAGGFPGWEIGTKIATTGSTMPDSLQRAVRTILCFQAGVTNLFL